MLSADILQEHVDIMNPTRPLSTRFVERPTEAFRLDGRVAVMIGGTGVLCGMLARGFAGAGAKVVLVGRDSNRAQDVLRAIEAAGGQGSFVGCDVCEPGALEILRDQVIQQYERIDILVNGAGINSAMAFFEISRDELDRIMTVNFKAVFEACQVFGQYFVERAQQGGPGASIINMGSASAIRPLSRVFTYSATKAAVHNLSANLAREWAPCGVRVNTLVPGFFPAEQNRRILTEDRVQSIMSHTPFGRFGEPQELVGAALLLASDAGGFMTGTELIVDGGFVSTAI